jgi:hypothetical protein
MRTAGSRSRPPCHLEIEIDQFVVVVDEPPVAGAIVPPVAGVVVVVAPGVVPAPVVAGAVVVELDVVDGVVELLSEQADRARRAATPAASVRVFMNVDPFATMYLQDLQRRCGQLVLPHQITHSFVPIQSMEWFRRRARQPRDSRRRERARRSRASPHPCAAPIRSRSRP